WAWSGVYVRRLRVILDRLRGELVEVDQGGQRGFLLRKDLRDMEKAATDRGAVRLLPSFDPFLQGHRRRDHLVDRAHYKQVYKDQGWLAPVVLLDGRVTGTWSYQRGDRKSTRLNSSHLVISYAVFCLKKNTMMTRIKIGNHSF